MTTSGAIKSASYVTNSGLQGSLEAILPSQYGVDINATSWEIPPVFGWIKAKANNITTEAFASKFNLGIGLVAVVSKGCAAWKSIDGVVEIGMHEMFGSHKKKKIDIKLKILKLFSNFHRQSCFIKIG